MACLRAKVLLLSLVVGSVRPAHLPSTPSCAAVAVAGTAQFARPLHAAASSRCCTTSPTHCCVGCCSSSRARSSAGAARAGYDAAPSVDADHVAQQPLGVGAAQRADDVPDLAPSAAAAAARAAGHLRTPLAGSHAVAVVPPVAAVAFCAAAELPTTDAAATHDDAADRTVDAADALRTQVRRRHDADGRRSLQVA